MFVQSLRSRGPFDFVPWVMLAAFTMAFGTEASVAKTPIAKLNANQVSYRTLGVALLRTPGGSFRQAPLSDAAMGRGDRVRYMVIATNQSGDAQFAGVTVAIPEYTEYVPRTAGEDAYDIVEATEDGRTWTSPERAKASRVKAIRWVMSDRLDAKMSSAFTFELQLTGPYSDRTGDLNATKRLAPDPVSTMSAQTIAAAQQAPAAESGVSSSQTTPAPAAAPVAANAPAVHLPDTTSVAAAGAGGAALSHGGDLVFQAAGVALVHEPNGSFTTVPLSKAHLKEGDVVRYAVIVRNDGPQARMAGATVTLPDFARFSNVLDNGGGIVELSRDGRSWSSESRARAAGQVSAVRWAMRGKLAPKASSTLTLVLHVTGDPRNAKRPTALVAPLAPAVVNSIQLTQALANRAATVFDGVPVTTEVAVDTGRAVEPGVVRSAATPVPTANPDANFGKSAAANQNLAVVAMIVIGVIVLGLGMYMFGKRGVGSEIGEGISEMFARRKNRRSSNETESNRR